MAEYPSGCAARPADEGARLVALTQLDQARAARRRLDDPDDADALHDLRVALRRLRTTLRAFGPQLDHIPRKLRRRLRDLARATGAARDSEVQLAWIGARRSDLAARRRAGLPWLLARLAARRDAAYAEIRSEVPAEFDRLETRLRKDLSAAPRRSKSRAAPPLGTVVAGLAQQHAGEATRLLDLLRTTAHEEDAHAARIQAKRLRYLLEPLVGEAPQAESLVSELRQLQDLLGELHDLHVLITELGDAVAEAAAERARGLHNRALGRRGSAAPDARGRARPASAGLLALVGLAAQAEKALMGRVTAEWLDGPRVALLAAGVNALADRLIPAPVLPVRHRVKAPAAPTPLPSRYRRRAPS